jgi:hypothetical protein
MSAQGQTPKSALGTALSAFHPIATRLRKSRQVRFVPILLQKSFWGDGRKLSEPLMRPVPRDVRDHIVSQKNDHGPSYWRYGTLQH